MWGALGQRLSGGLERGRTSDLVTRVLKRPHEAGNLERLFIDDQN